MMRAAVCASTACFSRSHFTGKERDTESGNDYFEARYYSSAMGRFMSPDWSDKPDPIPYADLEDPQTLNLYSYVRNNPLTRRDLNGHCTNGGQQQGFWWCLFHESDQDRTAKAARIEDERQRILHGRHADGSPLTAAERTRIERASQTQIDELFNTILENTSFQQAQAQGTVAPSSPDGLSRDSTGKVHGDLPDQVPDSWSKDDLEWTRDELKESIKTRKAEAQRLGEDGPHRERLRQEEQLLRAVEKKLSGS